MAMGYSGVKPYIDPSGQQDLTTFTHADDSSKKVPATVIAGQNTTDPPATAYSSDPAVDAGGLATRDIPRVAASVTDSTSSAVDELAKVAVNGGCSVGVAITFTGTVSSKINFEISNDATETPGSGTWFPVALERSLDGTVTTFTSVAGFFRGNIPNCKYFRCYTKALSSGTVNANVRIGYHPHQYQRVTPLVPQEIPDTSWEPDTNAIAQGAAGDTILVDAKLGSVNYLSHIAGTMSDLGTVKLTDGVDDLTGPMDINQLNGILGQPTSRGNEHLCAKGENRPIILRTTLGKFNGYYGTRTVPTMGVVPPAPIRGRNFKCIAYHKFGTDTTGTGAYGRIDTLTQLGRRFFSRYVYNGGTLDHLNDEIERYQDFNSTSHNITTNSIKLHAEALGSAGTGLCKSAMLRTRWVGKYGYFAVNLKVPKGSGIWPAVWLNPQDSLWPPEIDIMEVVDNTDTSTDWTGRSFHGVIHSYLDGTTNIIERPSFDRLNKFFAYEPGGGIDYHDDFHTFAAEVTPREVLWFVDDVLVRRNPHLWRHSDMTDGGYMHLIVNLAIGGGWAGTPNVATLPCDLEVKWIQIWQQPGVETGYLAL